MSQALFRFLLILGPKDRLVRVRSWWPLVNASELLWPCILVDRDGYKRETWQPVWDWQRLRVLLRLPQPKDRDYGPM